jgi:hypothetical protein
MNSSPGKARTKRDVVNGSCWDAAGDWRDDDVAAVVIGPASVAVLAAWPPLGEAVALTRRGARLAGAGVFRWAGAARRGLRAAPASFILLERRWRNGRESWTQGHGRDEM